MSNHTNKSAVSTFEFKANMKTVVIGIQNALQRQKNQPGCRCIPRCIPERIFKAKGCQRRQKAKPKKTLWILSESVVASQR
jgi:hypothetical protein